MKNILLTGGIGDILALDSFMSPEEKMSIKGIYLATRPWKEIIDLYSCVDKKYTNLKFKRCIYDKWSLRRNAIYLKDELNDICDKLPEDWEEVEDFSILNKFEIMKKNGYKPYHSSSWLDNKVYMRSRFHLPKKYVVIVPSSGNHYEERNFTIGDWNNIIKFLHKNKLYGIILKNHDLPCPKHNLLIDLTGQTSLIESFDILKKARGYFGIDSCLSVLASKIQYEYKTRIKSINIHLYNWVDIYYAPNKDFYVLDKYINCNDLL